MQISRPLQTRRIVSPFLPKVPLDPRIQQELNKLKQLQNSLSLKIEEAGAAIARANAIEPIIGEAGADGETIVGPQGEQGIQGEAGPQGEKGERGERGLQGDRGEKGDQGIAGKDGEKGKDGKNGTDATVDIPAFADKMAEYMLKEKKLTTKHIGDFTDGLEQTLRPIRSLVTGFRGGGDTVGAGSGITITNTNGVRVISASGGAGFQVPTGTVNGVNQTFVFTTAPNVIVVDQGRAMQRVSSDGTVNWTLAGTTATLSVAPTFDIYATA